MEISINLNDKVKVKLTSYGMSLLKKWENDILTEFPSYKPHYSKEVEKRGYLSMQLHVLFMIFGEFHWGCNCPFEDCKIIIDE